jgi:hypothetical protein
LSTLDESAILCEVEQTLQTPRGVGRTFREALGTLGELAEQKGGIGGALIRRWDGRSTEAQRVSLHHDFVKREVHMKLIEMQISLHPRAKNKLVTICTARPLEEIIRCL